MTHFISEYRTVVTEFPESVAIVDPSESLGHEELWNRARGLATTLKQNNVLPGDRVGVLLPKSCDFVATVLACWMIQAVWVPIDPDLPKARAKFYAKDAQVKLSVAKITPPYEGAWILPRETRPLCAPTLSKEGPAYLLYSSGTTGRPKGVLVSHRGIVDVVKQQIKTLNLGPDDRVLWLLSTQFDASISDLGVSLLSGAQLIIDESGSPIERLHRHSITYADLPPAFLKLYAPKQFPDSLRTILIGGETCPPFEINRHRHHRKIVLVYGLTEATICSTMLVLDKSKPYTATNIGFPLSGVRFKIVSGQLWLSGQGLAIGYWRQPEPTAKKWVTLEGTRWFLSGDRVRVNSDGSLSFLGRIDRQLKWNGCLVAPEEIESVMTSHPKVNQASVVLTERNNLVLCVGCSRSMTQDEARGHLAQRLPKRMIPNHILLLQSLPLSTSGKINHSQVLEEVKAFDFESGGSLWRDLFQIVLQRPCTEETHFELAGGDSLRRLELIEFATRRGLSLSVEDISRFPTPAELTMRDASLESAVSDFRLEKELKPPCQQQKHPMTDDEAVLLTGATGRLGNAVLKQLVARGCSVRTLVRANDVDGALARLSVHENARLEIICGDILDPVTLAEFVDVEGGLLLHCAADVSIGKSREELYDVNVGVVEKLFSFQHLNHRLISTLAVLLASNSVPEVLYEDDDLKPRGRKIFGGYAQTKWMAERLAEQRAIPRFRFGHLNSTGDVHQSNWIDNVLRSFIILGAIPIKDTGHLAFNWTPTDDAARAFVDLALRPDCHGCFHVATPQSITIFDVYASFKACGLLLSAVTLSEFLRLGIERDERCVRMACLSFMQAQQSNFRHPFNVFLQTGVTFDDTRLRTQLGWGMRIEHAMTRFNNYVRALLETQ